MVLLTVGTEEGETRLLLKLIISFLGFHCSDYNTKRGQGRKMQSKLNSNGEFIIPDLTPIYRLYRLGIIKLKYVLYKEQMGMLVFFYDN